MSLKKTKQGKKTKHVLQPECLHSPVEDLGSLVAGEVLQLQRLLGEEGHGQVEVVVPQLPADRHEKKEEKKKKKEGNLTGSSRRRWEP